MILRRLAAMRSLKSNSTRKLRWIAAFCLFGAPLTAAPTFQPDETILLRPFGDSITYGVGFPGSWGFCPFYIPPKGDPKLKESWCTQPPVKSPYPVAGYYGGGYRGRMTAFAVETQKMKFRTEGYQNGASSLIQWNTGTQSHDGYPGYRTDELIPWSQTPSFSDATLVHAGTNDLLQSVKPAIAFQNLVTITGNLLKANTKTHVFVAQIIKTAPPLANYAAINANIKTYNDRIASDLLTRLKQDVSIPGDVAQRVTIVDMSGILDPKTDYWVGGIHPNGFGYSKMACKWQQAIYSIPLPCPGDKDALKEMEKMMQAAGAPPINPLVTPEDFINFMRDQTKSEAPASSKRSRERSRQR
jgi:lysophospholipase L1-like esterase